MELIIDIPEEKYNMIKSELYNTFPAEMKELGLEAIRNGITIGKYDILIHINSVITILNQIIMVLLYMTVFYQVKILL